MGKIDIKNCLVIIIIFLLPFRVWGGLPATGCDEPVGGKTDTSNVYNLLDTLSLQLGENRGNQPLGEEKSLKDNLFDLVHGAIFKDTTNHFKTYQDDLVKSEERFRDFAGKTISGIYLKKLPVFGGLVGDSLSMAVSKIEKFGNSLHVNTQDWVIYQNLLFKEGDRIKPFTLADNERILRQLPFIRDARILVVPRKEEQEVDVLILTRDVFSIGVNLNIRSETDIAVSVFDRNLFGNGWEFRNTFRHRAERDPALGYEGIFDVRNLGGSFINGTLRYSQAFDMQEGRLIFSKEYLTQETRYAGGLEIAHSVFNDEAYNYKTVLFGSNQFDIWIGRSFIIGDVENRNDLKLGIRYLQNIFEDRPPVRSDTNFSYHNQKLYLGNILFNNLRYYTSHMILGFGLTEDIPQGYALEFNAGYAFQEFKERLYGGGQFWLAYWINKLGYFAFTTQISSFIHRTETGDGMIKIGLNYFSPLLRLEDYRFRHFLYFQYIKGLNRQNDKFIDIKDSNGIRGLSQNGLSGLEKLVITLEERMFTPWSVFGFRFTLLSFVDIGFIGDGRNLLNHQDLYSAIGLGCRIRNEGLVLQTVNLRIAYYPKVPGGTSQFGFKISLSEPVLFSPLRLGKPRIYAFE